MSYMDIDNLYKNQEILMFKECYAMEKIHGTSAHITWKDNQIKFSSGGENHERFVKLFNEQELKENFKILSHPEVVIYGEAYGGKCQKMSNTYGKELKFIAFEVKIGESWLDVISAEQIVDNFGLEFVYYERVSTDLKVLDAERDKDSVQAVRNGMGEGHKREGIVLRPLIELRKNNGTRIIAKHKGEEFKETNTSRKVIDPEKLKVLEEANAIATEWVTEMRLTHVLDKFPDAGIEKTGDIIKAMIEDVLKESKKEIVDSKPARTAIGKRAAVMFKQRLQNKLREE